MDKFISNNPHTNVYTARLNLNNYYTEGYLTVMFGKILLLTTYMIYKETSKKGVEHYHIYMTTPLSIRRIQQILQEKFPKIVGSMKSTHVCYSNGTLKDENLWKSKTYVAKEGALVASSGFSKKQLDEFYRIGSSIQKSSKIRGAVYKQIIQIFKLDATSTFKEIIISVYEYYSLYRARKYPNYHILNSLIEQILFNLNDRYFQKWKRNEIAHRLGYHDRNGRPARKQYDKLIKNKQIIEDGTEGYSTIMA